MERYIWTDHALERKRKRRISDDYAERTIQDPDRMVRGKGGSYEIQKQFGERTVSLIAKKKSPSEFIIVSCWVNPPMPGTLDYRRRRRYFIIQKSYGMKWLWNKILYWIGI